MNRCLSNLLNFEQQGIVQRVVRVDHAGEYAAYKIYAGQIKALKDRPIRAVLQKMQEQEKEHLREMERLCSKYKVVPTIFTPFYHFLAYGLGYATARFGSNAAMACTVAVEELIAKHYNQQIKELIEDNPTANSELLEKLSKFRDDEIQHHDTAVEHHGLETPLYRGLKWVIQTGCKTAILVSSRI